MLRRKRIPYKKIYPFDMIDEVMIDYARVFTGLPEIMGIPMKMFQGKWYASRKIDGSYSMRWDKLVCRMVDDGIQVLEQGGETMTLFNWMIKYGGCRDRFAAKMRLIECGAGYLPMPEYKGEDVETRYVLQRNVDLSVEARLQTHDNLTMWLKSIFDPGSVETVLRMYQVGVGRRYVAGAYRNMTQFWYIDSQRRVLHDKLMLYRPDGHRDREIAPGRMFKKSKGYNSYGLFGEHLIPTHGGGNVYVVESEKTALLGALYYGKGLWLACGGKNNLRACGVKEGWKILPDVDAFKTWKNLFGGACIEWWSGYKGVEIGEKWDIGDLIVERLIKK
jgi:hypothetical protein